MDKIDFHAHCEIRAHLPRVPTFIMQFTGVTAAEINAVEGRSLEIVGAALHRRGVRDLSQLVAGPAMPMKLRGQSGRPRG